MPAQLIDGKALAASIKGELRAQVDARVAKGLRRLG